MRTSPPSEFQGWTIHFIKRETRYWIAAQAGQKRDELFRQGTKAAWAWASAAEFIRWFSDGEQRYGNMLWQLASVTLAPSEAHRDYGRRKVRRQGLEVAIKIKGSQGQKQVEWVKVEHPFTAISPENDVHANHNETHNSVLKRRASAYRRRQNLYASRVKLSCYTKAYMKTIGIMQFMPIVSREYWREVRSHLRLAV